MPFPSNERSDLLFNNADSFAKVFDDEWKRYESEAKGTKSSTEEKLEVIFKQIKNHPFLKEYPEKAKEVAKFRLRLLKLE